MSSYKEIFGKELYKEILKRAESKKLSVKEFLRNTFLEIIEKEKIVKKEEKTDEIYIIKENLEKLEMRIEELASRMGFIENNISNLEKEIKEIQTE